MDNQAVISPGDASQPVLRYAMRQFALTPYFRTALVHIRYDLDPTVIKSC